MLEKLLNLAQVAAGFQVELRGGRRAHIHEREVRQCVPLDKLPKINDEAVAACSTRRYDPIPHGAEIQK
ncbi:MAG: hypothetical protein P4L56_24150 [Candidatus Sulfopaludibacter sp.]|nr:hypothetical protein [Candidatus Sulfopaludibacter sp.]